MPSKNGVGPVSVVTEIEAQAIVGTGERRESSKPNPENSQAIEAVDPEFSKSGSEEGVAGASSGADAVELDQQLEDRVRASVRERILREAGYEEQVSAALGGIERPDPDTLITAIKNLFADAPKHEWRERFARVAAELRGATE